MLLTVLLCFTVLALFQHIFLLWLTTALTFPEIFSISPRKADSNDDLPQPTLPTMATSSPWEIFRSILKLQKCIKWHLHKHLYSTTNIPCQNLLTIIPSRCLEKTFNLEEIKSICYFSALSKKFSLLFQHVWVIFPCSPGKSPSFNYQRTFCDYSKQPNYEYIMVYQRTSYPMLLLHLWKLTNYSLSW